MRFFRRRGGIAPIAPRRITRRRLLKERYAERIQCVVRYQPNRDGNHHGNKRNASNLYNDRVLSRIAFHAVHEILVLTMSSTDGASREGAEAADTVWHIPRVQTVR